jgi:hypothetical protein
LRVDWVPNDLEPDDPCSLLKGSDGLCAEAVEDEDEPPYVSDRNQAGCPLYGIKPGRGSG